MLVSAVVICFTSQQVQDREADPLQLPAGIRANAYVTLLVEDNCHHGELWWILRP